MLLGRLGSATRRGVRCVTTRMTPELETARYLFDLNGYLVIRNVFSPEEIAIGNEGIDRHLSTLHERTGKLRTKARGELVVSSVVRCAKFDDRRGVLLRRRVWPTAACGGEQP